MFVIDAKNTIQSIEEDCIKRYQLPPSDVLTGKHFMNLLALIFGPNNHHDLANLENLLDELKDIKRTSDLNRNVIIQGITYKMSFRRLTNGNLIGSITNNPLFKRDLNVVHEKKKVGANDPITSPLDLLLNPKTSKSQLNPSKLKEAAPTTIMEVTAPRSYRQAPRILVVDDSEVNREVANIFLESSFPGLLFAKNGQEALELLEENHVDIILMDIHMNVMNGVETSLKIRQSSRSTSDVIIIALTSDTAYQQPQAYKNVGMDDFISKPIRQDILTRTILKHWNAVTHDTRPHATAI